jgi:hypothetical protein
MCHNQFCGTSQRLTGLRQHYSGENMAEAVWQTMELYGLVGRVSFPIIHQCILLTRSQIIAIIMDNASNNNTLMTSLESRCQQRGISFSAQDARMRCMPHTMLRPLSYLGAACPLMLPLLSPPSLCVPTGPRYRIYRTNFGRCRDLDA